jgi:hypothetical protein
MRPVQRIGLEYCKRRDFRAFEKTRANEAKSAEERHATAGRLPEQPSGNLILLASLVGYSRQTAPFEIPEA